MANLVSINVAPDPNTLPKGTTMYYGATGYYDDNTNQNLTSAVTWISNDEGIAIVNSDGIVTSVDIGETEISAVYELITSNKAALTVTTAIIVNWEVDPEIYAMQAESTVQIGVKKVYTDGSKIVAVIQSCVSSNMDVATVTNAGLVTGVSTGVTYIDITVLDDDSNPVVLTVIVLIQPTIVEQITTRNYITNGQFQKFNEYIIPDYGRVNVSHATKTYPFYVTGKEKVVVNASAGGYPNEYPNFGKILFYKTGTSITGTDFFLTNTVSSDGLPVGTAQYAGIHYCTDYYPSDPCLRWYEFPCASITEFNNEDVRIKGSFTNISPSPLPATITVDIYYRQYYSDIDDFYVACPITLILQPSLDPENPDILNFDDVINIQAVTHNSITENSFFSLAFRVTCDGSSFGLGFTNIGLYNTTKKDNNDIDAVNTSFKAYQLPSTDCISDISRIGNVLTLLSDINTVGNYVSYNRPTLEYKSILPVGTVLPYEGSGNYSNSYNAQSLVTDGFLFLNGVTITRTRFQKLFTQQCQHSTTIPLYGWGNDGHITAIVDNSIYPGYARISVPLTYPPSGTTTVTGFSGFNIPGSIGTTEYYYTYIGCPSGESVFNDISNGGGYIKFYATNNIYYILFVVNNVIVMPYITPMLPIDINQTNIVYAYITDTMSSAEVTSALVSACNPLSFAIGDYRGVFLRNCDLGANIDPDAASRIAPFSGIASAPGSYQASAMTTHTHGTSNLKVKYNDVTAGSTISCQRYMMEGVAPSTHDLLDGSIDNAGASTESRPPNIYTNYIIKF